MASLKFKHFDPHTMTKKKSKLVPSKPAFSIKPSERQEPGRTDPPHTQDDEHIWSADTGFADAPIDLTSFGDSDDEFPSISDMVRQALGAPGNPEGCPLSDRPPSGQADLTADNTCVQAAADAQTETAQLATPGLSDQRGSPLPADAASPELRLPSPIPATVQSSLDEVQMPDASSNTTEPLDTDASRDMDNDSDLMSRHGHDSQDSSASVDSRTQCSDHSSAPDKRNVTPQDEGCLTPAESLAVAADKVRVASRQQRRPMSAGVLSEAAISLPEMDRGLKSKPLYQAASVHGCQSQGDSANLTGLRSGRRYHGSLAVGSDAGSDCESYRATKRRRLLDRGYQAITGHHSRRSSLSSMTRHTGIEDRLRAILDDQDDEISRHQFAIFMMRTCLSIIETPANSNLPSLVPSSLSPRASSTQPRPDSDRTDLIEEGSAEEDLDEAESDQNFSSKKRLGKHVKRMGQRRRWTPLEEKRLEAYLREKKDESWIARKLGRSECAVRQHWDIMCRK